MGWLCLLIFLKILHPLCISKSQLREANENKDYDNKVDTRIVEDKQGRKRIYNDGRDK